MSGAQPGSPISSRSILDHDNPPARSHRFAASFQDAHRISIVPIMQNMFEQIDIGFREINKKVSG
jgi:hypothetical protein